MQLEIQIYRLYLYIPIIVWVVNYPLEEFRSALSLWKSLEIRVWGSTEHMAMEDVIEHKEIKCCEKFNNLRR